MIVGTCIQTVVTAEDSVAGGSLQLFGNSSFLLDRQVGDAAAGIQLEGFDDRAGRAGIDAFPACSAAADGRWQEVLALPTDRAAFDAFWGP